MTDEELETLSAEVFAIRTIVQMFLADTLGANGNLEGNSSKLVEGVLRLEESVRQELGYDHPFALKITEALTSLVDQAKALAEQRG